ncbi:hypothetical protein B566_EDAN004288 [Ephemera danica]|nr:hypothetical protein B566_EDAN004288 [Ephemera danica]
MSDHFVIIKNTMRLQPVLESFSRGPKKGPSRGPAREPFPFQELLPLKLKNSVSGKGEKTTDVACLQEMAILFACFKKNDFNQMLCSQEINSFTSCYQQFDERKKAKKALDQKGVLTPGSKNLTHKQINQLFKKYPDPGS